MNYPIKVLVLDTVMDRGGAESMIMNYLRNIDRSKIQMDFMVNRQYKGAYEDEIKSLGGKVFRMCSMYPKNFRRYKKEIREFLKSHPEYKIIHSNLEERSYFPLKEAKKLNIPVRISHAHNAPKGFDIKTIVRYYFRARLKSEVTHMFACGQDAGDWLYGKRYRKDFIIQNNAIDAKAYKYNPKIEEEVRKEFNLEGKFVIGHVGRFFLQKNHNFLIDIFNEVYKKDKSAVLLLIGDGELKKEIEKKVLLLGLENSVKFLGVREDVNRLMQAFNIFLLPSLFEGLPVTMIEAQAAGLKCIISDKVTKECDITGNVERISLNVPAKKWAEKILKTRYEKEDTYEKIKEAKYDIKENALWLENFYIHSL
ncbi:MAG: glycosyltransferase family 1 protein [Clostridium sp.]|jgi:glycosyltransferase involved in cell wall biosynthesis|nr:glycosyltransferase family 1 protein [Clostridium sp.]